jgi:hypothetical protein
MKIQQFLVACAISVFALAAKAATFQVTTNADSGAGSLRQAILDANADSAAATIAFSSLPLALATITPLTPLPAVAANVSIAGGTQPNTFVDYPGVEINGSLCTAPQSSGIVTAGKISYIRFTRWNSYGIEAIGDAFVGGCIVGFGAPNANGIRVADRAHIGGNTLYWPNLIAGNTGAGIVVTSSTAVVITGNDIGADTAPNAIGLLVESGTQTPLNLVIGTAGLPRGTGNHFARNTSAQLEIRRSSGVIVGDNDFGLDTDTARDYVGIRITDSSTVSVQSNRFTALRIGVSVEGTSSRNTITGNRMVRTGIGIDLNADGRTSNDNGDSDSGPNGLQNSPDLTGALLTETATTIFGNLNSTPNQTFEIAFYSNAETCGAAGTEGREFRGTKSVTTDATGNAPFSFVTTALWSVAITATATDALGNTSEFSSCIRAETNGAFRFLSATNITEGLPAVSVTVTRTGGAFGPVKVDYATADESATAGADYTAVSGTLSFAAGETSKVITIPLLNDTFYEGIETFVLKLSNPTAAALLLDGQTQITINDDELRPVPVIGNVSTPEGNSGKTNMPFVVTLSGAPSAIPLKFQYFVGYGTATAGSDFDPVTYTPLTFLPGQTTVTINVAIIGDTNSEADETFPFIVSTASNASEYAQWTATGTILNDDGIIELRVEDITVVEGDSGIRNVNVRITASSPFTGRTSIATLDGTAVAGSDYTARGVELNWLNSREETFALVTYGDPNPEDDETFQVRLSTSSTLATIAKPVGIVTIENDDPEITPASQTIARGAKKSITVKLARPAISDAILTVAAAQPGSFQVPAQVSVSAGVRIFTFDVTALAAPASSRIDVTFPPGLGDRVLSMNVTSFEPVTLDLRPSPVKVAVGSSETITASLSPAVLEEQTITLAAADPHVFAVQPSITIPPGGSATFTVTGREVGSSGLQATLPSRFGGEIVTLFVEVVPAPAAPLLFGVTPGNGPPAGGTTLTLSGSRMKSDCSITFEGAPAQATFVSETQFNAISPAHAPGTVDVRLSCSSGASVLTNAFTYLSTGPTLASITPSTGNIAGGTIVKLVGTGLSSACGVFFDGTPAHGVEAESATTLTAVAPPHSTATVNLSVRCGGTTTTLGNAFSYNASEEPSTTIAGISPESGSPGQTVTITGNRFRARDTVSFDTSAAALLTTTGDTHVVRVPDMPPGRVAVTITDPNGHVTTSGPLFTVLASTTPSITRATPSTVIAGNEIVVDGDGFRAGYTFAIGDRAAAIISMTYTRAVIRVPAIDAGTYPLNIVNAAGSIAAIGPSIVVASHGVAVNGISTTCGSTDGGETITIRGSGFGFGASVTIANVAATNVIVVDANTITATIPASSNAGSARIVVTNTNGDSGSLTGAFRYVSPFDPDGCGGIRRRVGSRP